jgi:hypothetical protein
MSYQFRHSAQKEALATSWAMTAFAWRGCCLEIFSRGEASIDDCLSALEEKHLPLGPEAHHPGAVSRLRTLSNFLETHKFSNHFASAIQRIDDWSDVTLCRPCLAHGVMVANATGVAIQASSHDGTKRTIFTAQHFTRLEMLELLVRLDSAQTRLHQQLGQVKAAARAAKI